MYKMLKQILKELKEIKNLLQVIVSNQEQKTKKNIVKGHWRTVIDSKGIRKKEWISE
ncbi:hypothetical protein JZO86_15345 [Enterococcus ureasiticus]|uniref:hypothetical protein n=1 Tax=Enterococcus ureasiticus TaxID=903984 RepID=UPI001A8DA194|nr:hypothetical protein [Enterococcus ureasiticus]MBO0475076.1 hypothetical protein [Enterococcus ureasiticus]